MEARAVARYQRIAPRKVRAVIDLIRGKDVQTALHVLRFVPRRACRIVEKVLRSALANAQNNYDMNPNRLYIHRIYADPGP
ncbi:MAG TPA: 50S ribosomal protein L22, partial [Limnochordales bacterium]